MGVGWSAEVSKWLDANDIESENMELRSDVPKSLHALSWDTGNTEKYICEVGRWYISPSISNKGHYLGIIGTYITFKVA